MDYCAQLDRFFKTLKRLTKNASRLSEDDVKKIANRTFVKELCSCWDSNDEGVEIDLYTGVSEDCATPRFLLMYLSRDWFGGWTSNDTTTWYEISEQEYLELCENDDIP